MIHKLLNFLGDFTVLLPEEEIKVAGVLREQGDSIVLECRATSDTKCLVRSQDKFQVYGTVAGTEITLLECYVSNAELVGMGFCEGKITLKPTDIVIGRSTKEQINVTRITSSIKELNRMFSSRVLRLNDLFTKENPALLDYTFPEAITAKDADGEIRIERSIKISNTSDTYSFQVIPNIKYSFDSSVPISYAIGKIASIRNLFSFFSDYYLPLGELTFTDHKESITDDCVLYQNYKEGIIVPDKPFLIRTEAFQEIFQSVLDNWQLFYDQNKHIAELFYEMITNHSLRTNRFLNICQCLETYSSCYRSEEAKKVWISDPNKTKSVTLKHRIEDLLIDTSQYLEVTHDQCSTLAEIISNARNYYTHYNKKRAEPTFICIASSSELLHFVLLLVIYKQLGIPQDAILECKKFTPYKNMDSYISDIK